MSSPHCSGVISTGPGGEALCSVAWETPASSWESVDPADAGSYFAAGFVFLIMVWATGKCVALILSLIRH